MNNHTSKIGKMLFIGLFVGMLGFALTVGAVRADSDLQTETQITATPQVTLTPAPTQPVTTKDCLVCHPDKLDAWRSSPHAHSADDPIFLDGWENMERSADCLLCHKATYNQETGEYLAEGVSCDACHGVTGADHPPADVPTRSDEEYCGTCHPTTMGEVRLSGHSVVNEVRCVDCHDPHSQEVLFENPDVLCKDCHTEDLEKMDETLSQIHLQEDISCADCHMLDVPHTFVFNFQHENTTQFFKGFDCTSEITASIASRVGTDHEVLGSYVEGQMNWPIVHRVSRLEAAPECADCHVIDDELRADFMALGYTADEVDKLAWDDQEYPALTENELNKLVARPKKSWSWVYWLAGVIVVFGVFEYSVTRKLGSRSGNAFWVGLAAIFRKKANRKNDGAQDEQEGRE